MKLPSERARTGDGMGLPRGISLCWVMVLAITLAAGTVLTFYWTGMSLEGCVYVLRGVLQPRPFIQGHPSWASPASMYTSLFCVADSSSHCVGSFL